MSCITDVTNAWVRDEVFGIRAATEFAPGMVEGTRFVVIAETPDGFRWQHRTSFCTGKLVANEDGFECWHQDCDADMADAQYLANRVNLHLMRGGVLNSEHWTPIQGCYGSKGWNEAEEYERERMEDGVFV